MPDLHVSVENPLPPSLPVGQGTALFLYGHCFHDREPVTELSIVVDGARHRVAAMGMPRRQVFDATQPDPNPRAYHSGFWATVPVEPQGRPGGVQLQAAVRLASGDELVETLERLEVVEPEPAPSYERPATLSGPGLIAICMATFDPDLALFRAQIESLRSQTDTRWICLVSDDCSSPDRFEAIVEAVGADERFVVSRSERRRGFYRNFERALRMVPPQADLVALCDHDDSWHPDKLQVLRGALGDAQLVYSDLRLTDADGRVLRDTLWRGRRNNHTNLVSLLIANTVTGAASLFRRELVDVALPFPDSPGLQFHDHWIALVALATGDIAYVDRPLYDYVQHAGAVFGEVTHRSEPSERRALRARIHLWRAAYFCGYLGREVQAQTLLVRCRSLLAARKRRALRRYVASARSPLAFMWLATRSLRRLLGLTETLGGETELAQGILWRWLTGIRARWVRSPGPNAPDASFPSPLDFEQKGLRRWRARL